MFSVTLLALGALIVVARAGYVPQVAYAAPEAPAHYDYGYTVSDPHTGDQKSQQESRRGDVVQGSYSLVDSDGTKRVVHYSADPHNGFNAVVSKEGVAVAAPVAYAAPAKIVTKVAAPAPIAYAAQAPLSYSAPAPLSYAAPAPLAYAAPGPVVTKLAYSAPAPVAYASPLVTKVAAPLTYAAPAVAAAGPIAYAAAPSYYH